MKTKILFILIFLFITNLFAQRFNQKEEEDNNGSKNMQQNNLYNQGIITTDQYTFDQILSKKINPEEYILGPGDILFVNIGGPKYSLIKVFSLLRPRTPLGASKS